MTHWWRILTALAVALVAVGGVVGVGVAGDGSTLLYPPGDQEQQTVTPGEEFELDLYVSEHGDLLGNGLEQFALVAEYNESQLTATDVESAGWFDEGNESVDILTDSDIDEEDGVVTFAQEIEPAGDGVLNTDRFATITFDVAEDAAGETVVGLEHSSARLAGDFEVTVFAQPFQEDGQNGPEIQIDSSEQSSDQPGSEDTSIAPGALAVTLLVGVTATAVFAAVALGREK